MFNPTSPDTVPTNVNIESSVGIYLGGSPLLVLAATAEMLMLGADFNLKGKL